MAEAKQDVAVFFDYENIAYSLRNKFNENPNFDVLMEYCQTFGRVIVAKAYANWSRHPSVVRPLQTAGFHPVQVPTYYGKNAVDIHLSVEATEALFTKTHVDTFLLLTGDSDFIPLAKSMRRQGKKVIAVGIEGATSQHLEQAVDELVYYHDLLNIYDILVQAVTAVQAEGDVAGFSRVKQAIKEIVPAFEEKNYTDSNGNAFSKFKHFVLEAERLGHVQVYSSGSFNAIYLPGQEIAQEEEEDDSYNGSLMDGYRLLYDAVVQSEEEDRSMRASSIKGWMLKIDPDFNEKDIEYEPNQTFSRFTDFVRSAEEKGYVNMTGKGKFIEVHPGENSPHAPSKAKPKPQPAPPAEKETIPAPVAQPKSAPATNNGAKAKQFMIAALRTYQDYPSMGPQIEEHCRQIRDQYLPQLPDKVLRQLLLRAIKAELLHGENGRFSLNFTSEARTTFMQL